MLYRAERDAYVRAILFQIMHSINRHFFRYFHSTFVWDGPMSYLRFVYDEQHKTTMKMLLKATNTISNIFPGIR